MVKLQIQISVSRTVQYSVSCQVILRDGYVLAQRVFVSVMGLILPYLVS